ncbi:hypothetical protein KPH14_001558 [Odynerus spinipes]|uniref:IRP30 n=1 Tax=Odynerus spinipes TaxID=1348599 RepID=A0AAD9RZ70_9HYME|nr:hypothetical protein KPH14_001558 [Odynerus spinipes]
MRGSCLLVVLGTILSTSLADVCSPEQQSGWFTCRGLTSLEQLSSLPDSVVGLRLQNSSISRIPSDAFGRFAQTLIELRITGCGVEKIEADAFRGLDKLQTLDLTNNRIETIEATWIRGLSNLRELIVLKNRIRTIDRLFYDLADKLEILDIAYNELETCIGEDDLKKLTSLKRILIASNPWSYRCRPTMAYTFKRNGVNWIKDWSVGDLLIEECIAHEPGADVNDDILHKCVDRKSFESITPILPDLERKVYELSRMVNELRKEVDALKKLS